MSRRSKKTPPPGGMISQPGGGAAAARSGEAATLSPAQRIHQLMPQLLNRIEDVLLLGANNEHFPRFVECVTPLIRLSNQLSSQLEKEAKTDYADIDKMDQMAGAFLYRQLSLSFGCVPQDVLKAAGDAVMAVVRDALSRGKISMRDDGDFIDIDARRIPAFMRVLKSEAKLGNPPQLES